MSAEKSAPAEKTESAPTPKKGSPIKTIAIVAVLMIAEGTGVFFVVGMTGKKPESAEAHQLSGADKHDEEQLVEVEFIEDKFQSMQGSQMWVWDAKMVLKVKKKNEKKVQEELERRESEIREAVATIFRKAQISQLREAGLETLNRQVTAYITKLIGKDADDKELIERLVIPRCKGYSSN